MAARTTSHTARCATASVACTLAVACASAGGGAAGTDRRTTAPAGVVLDDRVETYPVHGRTVAELRRSMTAAAPAATGTNYRGLDEAALAWRWRAVAGAGAGCELRDVVVTVSSTIRVPTWVPDSMAVPGLREQWAAYDAALRRHERGHEARAANAGGELARELRHVRATRCADAADAGNRIGRATLDALHQTQRQYDDSTGHGRTQGATWPPPSPAPPAVR